MYEAEVNQLVADQICATGQFDGRPYRPGECLALLDGRVVAAARDLAGALRALRALDADPRRGMVFEVGPCVTDVIR